MKVLTTQDQLRDTKHEEGIHFLCAVCGQTKPVQTSGGTGYAYPPAGEPGDDKPICYACCGERDKAEMIKHGKATLYLSKTGEDTGSQGFNGLNGEKTSRWQVGNWPGTLKLNAFVRKGSHNMAGSRYDAWFTGPDGKQWHGVNYGENSQLLHCKRLKAA